MPSKTIAAITAVLLMLTACGGGDTPEWETAYRDAMAERYDAMPAAELFDICNAIASLTDDEMVVAGGLTNESSTFALAMAEIGYEPSKADFDAAAKVATGIVRARCK